MIQYLQNSFIFKKILQRLSISLVWLENIQILVLGNTYLNVGINKKSYRNLCSQKCIEFKKCKALSFLNWNSPSFMLIKLTELHWIIIAISIVCKQEWPIPNNKRNKSKNWVLRRTLKQLFHIRLLIWHLSKLIASVHQTSWNGAMLWRWHELLIIK